MPETQETPNAELSTKRKVAALVIPTVATVVFSVGANVLADKLSKKIHDKIVPEANEED